MDSSINLSQISTKDIWDNYVDLGVSESYSLFLMKTCSRQRGKSKKTCKVYKKELNLLKSSFADISEDRHIKAEYLYS